MTSDVDIIVSVQGRTNGAKVVKRSLDDVGRSADKATASTKRLERQTRSLERAANLLKTAFTGLIAAMGLNHIRRMIDDFTTLETQLKNVTATTVEYERVFNRLFSVAQRNGDVFTGLSETYVKLNNSLPDAVKNSTDLVKVTELLSRGFAVSGTNAQTAAAASLQLTQGLSSNFEAAAQELNSLIEGAPLLARLISEQLGGQAATDLKRLAEAGDLTAESFLNALIAAEDAIGSYGIPPTIERSLQRLQNRFLQIVGQSGNVREAAQNIASGIDDLARSLDDVLKVSAALVATTLPALTAAIGRGMVGAVTALTVAVRANPLFFATSILSGAITAAIQFKDQIFLTRDGITTLGDVFNVVFDDIQRIVKGAMDNLKSFFRPVTEFLDDLADHPFFQRFGYRVSSAVSGATSNLVQRAQIRALRDSMYDQADFNADTVRSAVLDGGPSNFYDIMGIDRETESAKRLDDAIKGSAESASNLTKEFSGPMSDAVNDIANDIERDFAGAFKSAFKESENIFDGFVAGLKSTFSDFLAEIVYQAAARPIVLSVVGAGASLLGANAVSGGLGGVAVNSGGSGFGGLTSVGSSLLSGGLYSQGLGNVGANIGANLFAGGDLLSGAAFRGSQALGNLGYGAIGGLGASLLGLGNENALVNTGASTVGALIGGAFGPVGAALGGFAGSAIGGLFGGSTPSGAISARLSLENGALVPGRFTEDESTAERQRAIKKLQSGLADQVNQIIASAGGSIANAPSIRISESAKRGGGLIRVGVGDVSGAEETQGRGFRNIESLVNYAVSEIIQQSEISGVSEDVMSVLRASASSGAGAEQILSDVNLARLVFGEDEASLKTQIESLNDQFEAMRDRAEELGIPLERVNDALAEQKSNLLGGVFDPLQDFLDNQALSSASTLNPAERLSLARSAFDENLASINAGDYSNIDDIVGQASKLLDIGRNVFASGQGFSSLESYVRQSVAGIDETLGAPGSVDDTISREIVISNAEQTSILEQMNVEIQQLREENRKLRKSMERVGNAVVRMTS